MKKTIGIMAHVDAGKTTLSEQILYLSGALRKTGRVDRGDSFLDTHPIERQRGITVFSGQACFRLEDDDIYWLDTPGHVDFSTEMERAASVMDYAVLVISSAEGVQSHTETLWNVLERYRVPTFIFLNKTDRTGADPDGVLQQIRDRLSMDAVDFRSWQQRVEEMPDTVREAAAQRDEELMERLFSDAYEETLWVSTLKQQISGRQIFPVLGGSGLTGDGVEGFLHLLQRLTITEWEQQEKETVTARVFRVRHDDKGQRLVFMKLLSGKLRVRETLPGRQDKINELRIYHGDKYHTVDEASAGDLIAVPGLPELRPGDEIGTGKRVRFLTEPMMMADLLWDAKTMPAFRLMELLLPLQQEEPSLDFTRNGEQIACKVMGRIQLEILRSLIQERIGLSVSFGPCKPIYKETIAEPTVGVGHYEPLRHYAQVVLRLVPTEPGSGISFVSRCHVDTLELNWQRLIETHVFEKPHHGVLTGAELTDIRVELLCGRSHLKHTEGGDFRQSVYRAIRNGLMYAKNILLEPVCGFALSVPQEQYGAVTGALAGLRAESEPAVFKGDRVLLQGEAAWSRFMPWQEQFVAMTHGHGTLRVWLSRYAPCDEQEAVVSASGYQPLAEEPADSVFCSHGAGYSVPWNEVRSHMHCQGDWFD